MESTISKLKLDNIQLKKKQEILEKNNHVLTLKLGEQGSNVVYLDKTPGKCRNEERKGREKGECSVLRGPGGSSSKLSRN